MNATNDPENSQLLPDDLSDKGTTDDQHTPQNITLSHQDAEAGSPFDNTGEEDPGAALESLVTEVDHYGH